MFDLKVERLFNIDGGTLVINLGSKKPKIALIRLGLSVVWILILVSMYSTIANIWLFLAMVLLGVVVFLFGDLNQIGRGPK